jgi:pimeloyl-ACP methyl ester carboxylesterase
VGVRHLFAGSTGRTVVLCHSAPGSGAFDPDPDATLKRGVTLLAVDRPGYGASEAMPDGEWATVAQAADDLAEVLAKVVSGPVGVAGWSAGGRVAMALAARHPELVERLAVIATPAPNAEVPWIPDEIQQGLDALADLPADVVHQAIGGQFEAMIPDDFASDSAPGLVGASLADADALALPGARERLAEMLRVSFAQGVTGLASDIAGYSLQPWGFDPADVAAKTLLVYGSADPVAANRHAAWWQRALPDARVEMTPGAGHLLILQRWERVLSHLAPGSKRI